MGVRSMSFSKSLVSSGLLAGAVFAIAVAPMAIFGSKPLTVHVGQRPVFTGQLRDLSLPYMGATTAASIGLGFASLAFAGWSSSSRNVRLVQKQMSELDRQLQEKEALIEDLAFSEAKLKALGLDAFLGQDVELGNQLTRSALEKSVASGQLDEHVVSEKVLQHPTYPKRSSAKLLQM